MLTWCTLVEEFTWLVLEKQCSWVEKVDLFGINEWWICSDIVSLDSCQEEEASDDHYETQLSRLSCFTLRNLIWSIAPHQVKMHTVQGEHTQKAIRPTTLALMRVASCGMPD